MPFRSGQAQLPTTPTTTTPAPTPATTSPEIAVGPDGRIQGIDGMLDQIASALMRQARTEILPTLQQDQAFQRTVGSAVGRELARPLWVLAGVAAAWAGYSIYQNERRSRRTSRSVR